MLVTFDIFSRVVHHSLFVFVFFTFYLIFFFFFSTEYRDMYIHSIMPERMWDRDIRFCLVLILSISIDETRHENFLSFDVDSYIVLICAFVHIDRLILSYEYADFFLPINMIILFSRLRFVRTYLSTVLHHHIGTLVDATIVIAPALSHNANVSINCQRRWNN